MKKKNTFLHSLPFLCLALLFTATIGCKDDDDSKPTNCSTEVYLDKFDPNYEIPYGDTLAVIELVSELDSTGIISVNHPAEVEFYKIAPYMTSLEVFDCEAYNSIEKYSWKISSQQVLVTVVLNHIGAPALMVKETPLMDEAKPQAGPLGVYLEFYGKDEFSGLFKDSPFMRVMTEELQAGKGSGYEKGFTLLGSITIKGETFEQVYTNTEPLMGSIKHIYYSRSLGMIGFKDEDNVLWRVGQ